MLLFSLNAFFLNTFKHSKNNLSENHLCLLFSHGEMYVKLL